MDVAPTHTTQITPRKRRHTDAVPKEPVEVQGQELKPLRSSDQIIANDISSDSSLSDPPSDLDSEFEYASPFFSNPGTPTKPVKEVHADKPRRALTKSPYFPKPTVKRISCLPFPPLSASRFGLMQERLAHDPFRMLIATVFLNKTRGEQAMPVYFELMEKYATIQNLADANVEDVTSIIHKLGFQNQRARKCIELAKAWLTQPPQKGTRYRKINYPKKGDGRDVKIGERVLDEDERVAWEIAHLSGLGAYALDSWRIFCRDKLRGLSSSWNGEGAESSDFEPEWKRVLPTDKELRAYLTWMWLKLGYVWNKENGERQKADEAILRRAQEGGIVHEEGEYLVLTATTVKVETQHPGEMIKATVERTAGDFMIGKEDRVPAELTSDLEEPDIGTASPVKETIDLLPS